MNEANRKPQRHSRVVEDALFTIDRCALSLAILGDRNSHILPGSRLAPTCPSFPARSAPARAPSPPCHWRVEWDIVMLDDIPVQTIHDISGKPTPNLECDPNEAELKCASVIPAPPLTNKAPTKQ
eukprot:3126720-Rhodomonas_salina.1